MPPKPDIALLFPPLWYFASVPADLSYPAGFLQQRGVRCLTLDASAGLVAHLFAETPSYRALRQESTYEDPARHRAAADALHALAAEVGRRHRAAFSVRSIHFADIDEGHVPSLLRLGLDPARNPALPYLAQVAAGVVGASPRVVAIALVHPDQAMQALVLGALLRRFGYRGIAVLYGSLEDVMAPADFAEDLVGTPDHAVFEHFDGVVVGEAESALLALCEGKPVDTVPNLVRRGMETLPERWVEPIEAVSQPTFGWADATAYPFPSPVVDVRLGRGCSFGRCAFCAIQSHQVGYRGTAALRLAETFTAANRELGSTYVRVRDDLVTPVQLGRVAAAVRPLGMQWCARARFEPGLGPELLREAAAAGLDELWMGLESAVPRVRDAMDKGVRQDVVERVLREATPAGLRIRALCMLGFPGETEGEALATIGFLEDNRDLLAAASLTPFQLMRRSPMATSPERWGIRVAADPVPRWERIRHTLPIASGPEGSFPRRQALLDLAVRRLTPIVRRESGPDPSHAWRAAVARRALRATPPDATSS